MTWRQPVPDPVVVTSPFDLARRHPVSGVIAPHTGADYRAAHGTPLPAAHAGTVTRSMFAAGVAGHYVRVQVDTDTWIGYSHMSRRDVSVGALVAAGQVLGLAGATGAATGPHLHFEVCVRGLKVDPVPYLAARIPPPPGPTVPPSNRQETPVLFIVSKTQGIGACIYPSGHWTLIPSGTDATNLAAAAGTKVVDVEDNTFRSMTPGMWKLV